MKNVTLIGITGGSGAGKSTLCRALKEKYPDIIQVIQLDDYFKPQNDVPFYNGYTNWECPEALFLEKLNTDLLDLKNGREVLIDTKNQEFNPDFEKTQKRVAVLFKPRPIILVEGYLLLWEKNIRENLSLSFYLNVSNKTRISRRVHIQSTDYINKVLIPMHKKYVEPTKKFATRILKIDSLNSDQVLEKIENQILTILKIK